MAPVAAAPVGSPGSVDGVNLAPCRIQLSSGLAHVAVVVGAVAPDLDHGVVGLVRVSGRCGNMSLLDQPGSERELELRVRTGLEVTGRDLVVAGEGLRLLADDRPVGLSVHGDGLGKIPQQGEHQGDGLKMQMSLLW